MSEAPTPVNSYFLTRQSANVMEDLSRLVTQAGSVTVLYGQNGVGKSRLLKQFILSRPVHSSIVTIRFYTNGTFASNMFQSKGQLFAQEHITQLVLNKLNPQTLLIVDQCEFIQPSVLHQIIKLFGLQGEQNKLKLVLCGNQKFLTLLNDLSDSLQMSINSVELKPLDEIEVIEFMRHYCCPEIGTHPRLTRTLKKQMLLTQGLISKLLILLESDELEIECEQVKPNSRSLIPMVVGALLVMFVIFTVLIVEPFNTGSNELITSSQVSQPTSPVPPPIVISESPIPEDQIEPLAYSDNTQLDQQVDDNWQTEQWQNAPELNNDLDVKPEQREEVADEEQVQEQEEVKPRSLQPEPTVETDTSEISEKEVIQPSSLYQRRIQATLQWLSQAQSQEASIQIMSVQAKSDSEEVLNRYMQRLQSRGLEADEVYIFSSVKKSKEIIGVLYGTFDNRRMARQRIKQLPKFLQVNQPIPRTVKGIKQEIQESGLL